NGELSGSPSGWRVYSPSPRAKGSNDLFGRANQRAVGLIGRVPTRNSPYGRAQRGRTQLIYELCFFRYLSINNNTTSFFLKGKHSKIKEQFYAQN
ncbi:MAG: hypothetical protein NTZ24_14595, partial [Deltaproteobacteria bacterium]|nr:hypothetical protein [Deltaproteobacteria bacterium]